jgi:hypothetical protein
MSTILTCDSQAVAQDLFESSSIQKAALGSKAVSADGRVFRYVKVGATALVPGKLYDGNATVANHQNCAVTAVAAIGATTVTFTLGATAATANQYSGGYLVVNDATGQGYTYLIKSHPAADLSASLTVTLSDALQVALDITSEVSLLLNQYDGLILHEADTETGIPVGVAIYPVTALYYGWIQSRGIISCLADAAPSAVGTAVAASTTTDGCVTAGTGVLCPIGFAPILNVSTEYTPIFLTID